MSNFAFLQPEWPGLHEAASKAAEAIPGQSPSDFRPSVESSRKIRYKLPSPP